MKVVPNTEPLSDGWRKYRSTRITASDACQVVAGYVTDPDAREELSRYGTPLTTYERLTSDEWELEPESAPNKAAIYGQWAEKMIVPWFEHDTGRKVTEVKGIVQSPDYPWLCCTTDGFVMNDFAVQGQGDASNAVFEMKAPSIRHHSIWENGVSLSHQIQMQVQMMCCTMSHGTYAVKLWPDLFIREVPFDYKLAKQVIDALQHFMAEHVEMRVPPPAINGDHDAGAMHRLNGYEKGETIALPNECLHASDRFDAVTVELRDLKREQDNLKLAIRDAMGSANKATLPDDSGWTVTTNNQLRRKKK